MMATSTEVQALLLRHSELIRGYIFALLGRHSDSDDVFQEVFLTATAKAEQFQLGTDFVAWACTIARYRVLRQIGDARRRPVLDPAVVARLADDADQGLEVAQWEDERLALRHCLQRLAPAARAVLEQRYVEDRSPQAIASRLGRSVNGVSVALTKARIALRTCVERRLGRAAGSP
jgi:RNA polymerase sigma-70 factor (ECF subfamily)